MKQTNQNGFFVFLGIALFTGLLVFLYFVLKLFFNFIESAQSQTTIAIVAGAFAIPASIIPLIITKHLEQKAAILQEHRSKKIPVYEEIIQLIFRLMFSERMGDQPLAGQDLIREFTKVTEKLMVWGSDDVINAYSTFRTSSGEKTDAVTNMRLLENIFLAIRRDIGHKNKKLSQDSLLKLFLNDLPK